MPLVAGTIVYGTFTFNAQATEFYEIKLQMKLLEEKVNKETESKQALLEQRDEITSDESIEKIAREKLGMVKDGERIFVDIDK